MPHTNTPPNTEPLAAKLPPGVYYQLVHTFCEALPPPLSDTPEHLALRNQAAIVRRLKRHPCRYPVGQCPDVREVAVGHCSASAPTSVGTRLPFW